MRANAVLTFCLTPFFLIGCKETGQDKQEGPNVPYLQVSFSPDGKFLVAAGGIIERGKPPDFGGDGVVKAWTTKDWKPHFFCNSGFTDVVNSVFFLDESEAVFVSDKIVRQPRGNPYEGTLLRAWNIQEKKELPQVSISKTLGRSHVVGINGPTHLAAFRNADGVNVICDVRTLEKKGSLDDRDAMRMRFSPDGKKIVSGVRENAPHVRLFDTLTGKRIGAHTLDSNNDPLNPTEDHSIQFSPNGKMIAIGADNPRKVYILSSNLNERLLVVETTERSDCVAFTPDSQMVGIIKARDVVELLEIKTKESKKTFPGNAEGVRAFAFSPDGSCIAISSGGDPRGMGGPRTKVRVFEVKTGKLVAELD